MTNILFGLVPAIMWGIQPLVMTKIGGKPTRKVMGMGLGIFIVALIVSIFKPPVNLGYKLKFIAFIDGLTLSYGLINQIKGLHLLGVSKGTPISTGTQLIGATLVGVIYFKEWTTLEEYILGTLALVLIILGVSLTAYEERIKVESNRNLAREGVITLILSSIGFVLYTVILRLANIDIWDALIPQGLGMVVGSYYLSKKGEKELFKKETFSHILTGFIFAIGNITLMISNNINGLALGFTLTQMSVIIATLGGLLILKEEKTRKELKYIHLGLILIVIGGVLIGITKK